MPLTDAKKREAALEQWLTPEQIERSWQAYFARMKETPEWVDVPAYYAGDPVALREKIAEYKQQFMEMLGQQAVAGEEYKPPKPSEVPTPFYPRKFIGKQVRLEGMPAIKAEEAIPSGTYYEELRRMGKTEPYISWFERFFPTITKRLGTELTLRETPGAGWAKWLQQTKPQIEEWWWEQAPFERGEYPSVYAPPIRTVEF